MIDNTSIDHDIKNFKKIINDFFIEMYSNNPCCTRIRLRDIDIAQTILGRKYNIKYNDEDEYVYSYMEFYDELVKLKQKKGDIYYYVVDDRYSDDLSLNQDSFGSIEDLFNAEDRGTEIIEIGTELLLDKKLFCLQYIVNIDIPIKGCKQYSHVCFDTRQEAEEFLKNNTEN